MSQIQVELQGVFGGDREIAESAWTSSSTYQQKQKRTDEDVKRVVQMLANNKHATPFESVVFRFWIKMPIAIDRQFMTHRIQSANGMSGRYRTMPSEFLNMPDDVTAIADNIDRDLKVQYENHCKWPNENYVAAMEQAKIAKTAGKITNDEYKRFREFYRGMLPVHNMTERVTTINLRSFANFIKLRLKPEAQPEIQEVARQMLDEVKKANVCPVAIEWLEKNNWEL